jgi:DNA-binding transcriptional MerR regulator
MVLAAPLPGHAPPATPTPMKIGELARRSGLPVKTLRYYEDFGLLPARGRSVGGYRLFGEESLRRLEFIRRLKTLGLSLEDIQGCLAVHDAGQLPCADIQLQLGRQIERIDGQIRELRQLHKELQTLLAGWQSDPANDGDLICPNLQV